VDSTAFVDLKHATEYDRLMCSW
jgi:hypothetical protein